MGGTGSKIRGTTHRQNTRGRAAMALRITLVLAATVVLGAFIAFALTGAPVYFVAGMSGFAAVGAAASAAHQVTGRKEAA